MENKISVVINTYNAEKHLRRVLESVKGFLDGVPGFINACMDGYYQLVMIAKILESK